MPYSQREMSWEKNRERNHILIGVAVEIGDFPTGGLVINGIVYGSIELRNTAID